MERYSCQLIVFFTFLAFPSQFVQATDFIKIQQKQSYFDKSIAQILKKEFHETGNKFVILFHSLKNNDAELDSLIAELHSNDVSPIFYSNSLLT